MTADKIVDASMLAAAVFLEPKAELAQAQLQDCELHAPTILRFEMASVCLKKIRSRPNERVAILEQYVGSMAIPIREHAVDHVEVVALAERFNLSSYDANYLWLARQLGVELVTLDANLAKAAMKP